MMKKFSYNEDRFVHALILSVAFLLFIGIHHSFVQEKQAFNKGVSETISFQKSDGILNSAYVLPQFNERSLVSKIIPAGSLPGNLEFSISIENLFHTQFSSSQLVQLTLKQGSAWMFAYLHVISSQGNDSPLIS